MNNSTQTPEQLSIGGQFRQARQALALSLEEVSKQLSLRTAILQQIENDEFIHKSIPATFMKGYVRSYAKFLKFPETLLAEINFGEQQANDLSKNLRSSSAINQYSTHSRWVGWLSTIVVILLCAMTGLWWWENYQKSNVERESLLQTYNESSASQEVNPIVSVDNSTLAQETSSNNEIPVTLNLEQAETEKVETEKAETPANTETVESANQQSPVVVPLSQPVLQEMVNLDNQVQDNGVKTRVAMGDLHIEVLGNCWISVKDNNGKILAQKEYVQGEILNFNQGAPYDVIIGAPSMVKITYKGEAYPLTVDGRVAKFKLQ